jgi:hypothetical protein
MKQHGTGADRLESGFWHCFAPARPSRYGPQRAGPRQWLLARPMGVIAMFTALTVLALRTPGILPMRCCWGHGWLTPAGTGTPRQRMPSAPIPAKCIQPWSIVGGRTFLRGRPTVLRSLTPARLAPAPAPASSKTYPYPSGRCRSRVHLAREGTHQRGEVANTAWPLI